MVGHRRATLEEAPNLAVESHTDAVTMDSTALEVPCVSVHNWSISVTPNTGTLASVQDQFKGEKVQCMGENDQG